uniref:Uncharacterized protein n=1 Tax=Hanusia phi TaxID=3032 RepID=A0A7S0F6C5_9CRYP|mmetsp:Transcript_36475/g.82225  ORF Transcript_36475/g.82225 Transcript_36475/m.82225 type:complete len:841 (+) Transcript_36475:140-2662(+)
MSAAKKSWSGSDRDDASERDGAEDMPDLASNLMPRLIPCSKRFKAQPFMKLDSPCHPVWALLLGLQHAVMAISVINLVPARIAAVGRFDKSSENAVRSCSLIVAAVTSVLHLLRVNIHGELNFGTGLVSLVGSSILFLPLVETFLVDMMGKDSPTACTSDADCLLPWSVEVVGGEAKAGVTNVGQCNLISSRCRYSGEEAYMKFVGTAMLSAVVPLFFGLVPRPILQFLFPRRVLGACSLLIGVYLCSVGFKLWGGGLECAGSGTVLCSSNGAVALTFGSVEYVGLGFVSFFIFSLWNVFSPPLLRSFSVLVSLLGTYLVAFLCRQGTADLRYVENPPGIVDRAMWGNFLYIDKKIRLDQVGFHAPLLGPLVIVQFIAVLKMMGDISSSFDASMCENTDRDLHQRIQGGILAGGIESVFSGIAAMMPLHTISHSNTVTLLSRCANRMVGVAAGFWLLLFGVIPKFGMTIAAIPSCVVGGILTPLFAGQISIGMNILFGSWDDDTFSSYRNRFLLASALTFGIGVAVVPAWVYQGMGPGLDALGVTPPLREAILLLVSAPFSVGTTVAVVLNLLLPYEDDRRPRPRYRYKEVEEELQCVVAGSGDPDQSTCKDAKKLEQDKEEEQQQQRRKEEKEENKQRKEKPEIEEDMQCDSEISKTEKDDKDGYTPPLAPSDKKTIDTQTDMAEPQLRSPMSSNPNYPIGEFFYESPHRDHPQQLPPQLYSHRQSPKDASPMLMNRSLMSVGSSPQANGMEKSFSQSPFSSPNYTSVLPMLGTSSLLTAPLLPPGWGICGSCENPVKLEWGSCPKCGTEVKEEGAERVRTGNPFPSPYSAEAFSTGYT